MIIADTGSAASQNHGLFQPPFPLHLIGHITVGDALEASTRRRVGADVCYPRARVFPKTENGNR